MTNDERSQEQDERVTPISQKADLAFTNPTSDKVIELLPVEDEDN
mgnify:CR=1 FL=1